VEDYGHLDARPLLQERRIVLGPDRRGPFEVRARWLYRRVNPAFTAFALGADAVPFPPWELAAAAVSIGQTRP
jgi:hypothetical protein